MDEQQRSSPAVLPSSTVIAEPCAQVNRCRLTFGLGYLLPNPSVNHNFACDIQHEGTAVWFVQGSKFDEWKKKGSLLWIRGNREFSAQSAFHQR